MLAASLIGINVLCAAVCREPWDVSARGDFSLSAITHQTLSKLKEPVEIVILAPAQPRSAGERTFQAAAVMLRELAVLYRGRQPLVSLQELDPATSDDAREWLRRFPDVTPPCALVVAGGGDAVRHEVLQARDLIDWTADARGGTTVEFSGEAAITAALRRLSERRTQAVLYVITGAGGLNPNDAETESRRGIGTLVEQLRRLDWDVRSLQLSGVPRIPTDADAVLLPGSEQTFAAKDAEKLANYLRHGGKGLFLFDSTYDPIRKQTAPHGLEALLEDIGLIIGNDRVITAGFTGKLEVASPALPAEGDHPLVKSLPATAITLYECRSVRLLTGVSATSFTGTPLLVSHAAPRAWAEGDGDPDAEPQPGGKNDLDGPVAMASAVERTQGSRSDPVLVAVGDAEFVSNHALGEPGGSASVRFVVASLEWLRGRRDLLADIPPRRRESIRLSGTPEMHRGLVWKSTLFLSAVIVTCGATVWTVRRRS